MFPILPNKGIMPVFDTSNMWSGFNKINVSLTLMRYSITQTMINTCLITGTIDKEETKIKLAYH